MLHNDITWRWYKILFHLPWSHFTYGNVLQGKTSTKRFIMDRIWALSPSFCLLCSVLVTRIWLVLCVISGFRREVDGNCALLCCYAASSGNSIPTFRNDVSGPSSRVKKPKMEKNMGPIGCPETSTRKYHCSLHNSPEERSSQDLTSFEFDGLPACSPEQKRAQNIHIMIIPTYLK
jgi:hypothetical protein